IWRGSGRREIVELSLFPLLVIGAWMGIELWRFQASLPPRTAMGSVPLSVVLAVSPIVAIAALSRTPGVTQTVDFMRSTAGAFGFALALAALRIATDPSRQAGDFALAAFHLAVVLAL